jgi:hypothetical protein
MTAKNLREYKLANQIRKIRLQRMNRTNPKHPINPMFFKSVQNGRQTAEAEMLA